MLLHHACDWQKPCHVKSVGGPDLCCGCTAQVEAASVSVGNMRRELEAKERRVSSLHLALAVVCSLLQNAGSRESLAHLLATSLTSCHHGNDAIPTHALRTPRLCICQLWVYP